MGFVAGLGEWRRGRDKGRQELGQGDAVADLGEEILKKGRSLAEEPCVNLRVMHLNLTVCSGGLYLMIDLTTSDSIRRGYVARGIWKLVNAPLR